MAKVLTVSEMCDLAGRIVKIEGPRNKAACMRFLSAFSELLCEHAGGRPGTIALPDEEMGWTVAFRLDKRVPADGGLFARYDKDVTWKDGVEE